MGLSEWLYITVVLVAVGSLVIALGLLVVRLLVSECTRKIGGGA